MTLEIKMIRKFVIKNKQERYISFVSSVKNRAKFIAALPHFKDFQWDKFSELYGNEYKYLSEITSRLKLLEGVSSLCYIVSEDSSIDTKSIDLFTIFNEHLLISGFATILVFGNADLIYYHDEQPDIYISKVA